MGLSVVVPLGLLALALVGIIVRRRRRRAARPAAATGAAGAAGAAEEGVPTFRVVALGSRGSGKTLLLASMYHQLQTMSGRGYFLSAPYEQVVLLNQWFTDVADTGRDWPSGTAVGETRDFMFTLRTRGASGALHPVLRLGYLEYAGGLLTDAQAPGSTGQAELLARIEAAHALVGIIDGYRVRQAIDGHAEGLMRLQQSLTAMIGLMMLVPCPVTFVITKWDLLHDLDVDEDARLRRVRKFLMSNQGFHDLVEAHSAQRVVRLIPVSAVGPDFATIDERGRVAKLPDGQLRPSNVDTPLSAVVPDVFEQIERALDRAALSAALERVSRRYRPGPAGAVAELGLFVARTAGKALGPFAPHAAFLGDAALEFFGGGDDPVNERGARMRRELTEAERTFEEFQLARRRVLRELRSRVDVLEGRLPSSRLSGED
jgi:hypothetical protein